MPFPDFTPYYLLIFQNWKMGMGMGKQWYTFYRDKNFVSILTCSDSGNILSLDRQRDSGKYPNSINSF
jgi:hypothetical protein